MTPNNSSRTYVLRGPLAVYFDREGCIDHYGHRDPAVPGSVFPPQSAANDAGTWLAMRGTRCLRTADKAHAFAWAGLPLPAQQGDPAAMLGRFVVDVLCADGPDAGDRLGSIVAQAIGLGLARSNPDAGEDTDPWLLPAGKAVRP